MASSSSSFHQSSTFNEDNIPNEYLTGKLSVTPQGSRTWKPIVDVNFKPIENKVFNNLDDAYHFYKESADKGGFEARKFAHKYVKDQSIIKLKWFVCSREGLKPNSEVNTLVDSTPQCLIPLDQRNLPSDVSSNPSTDSNVHSSAEPNATPKKKQRRERASQRIGCQACIRVGLNDQGKYEVYIFREDHNHALVRPEYRKHLKSNRRLDFGKKQTIHSLGDAGIGPVVAHRVLTKIHGGHENVGATNVDTKNYKRNVNAYIGGADAQMVVNMLTEKTKILPDFSFYYFTVNKGEIAGMFWADETSKRNYLAFGDIVSFDATYRSNRCVTFGGGLLAKEDFISYDWLLSKFKSAYPREPQIVLTDQDPAMKQGIKAQFLSARHRLCMWHITDKVTTKVGATICRDGFERDWSRIVWTDKLDPEEFEELWFQILSKYDVLDNKWLKDMYELREIWIPAYFRSWNMSALMRTSSRSESENHMFGQLMSSSSTLVEFFTFFETAMTGQRFTQSKNDHESTYTTPDIKTDIPFEVDAIYIYTRAMFFEVQNEICAAVVHCYSVSQVDEDGYKKYTIIDSSVYSTKIDETIDREANPHTFDELIPINSQVSYNQSDGEMFCTCKKFESSGMLCRHIFYVLRINKVKKFPSKYICSRWTRDVVPPKNSHIRVNIDGLDVQRNQVAANMREIYFFVDKSVHRLIRDNDRLSQFLERQKQLFEEIQSELGPLPDMSDKEFIGVMLGVKQPAKIDVFPLKVYVTKVQEGNESDSLVCAKEL